jgi:hypothetical protein
MFGFSFQSRSHRHGADGDLFKQGFRLAFSLAPTDAGSIETQVEQIEMP